LVVDATLRTVKTLKPVVLQSAIRTLPPKRYMSLCLQRLVFLFEDFSEGFSSTHHKVSFVRNQEIKAKNKN